MTPSVVALLSVALLTSVFLTGLAVGLVLAKLAPAPPLAPSPPLPSDPMSAALSRAPDLFAQAREAERVRAELEARRINAQLSQASGASGASGAPKKTP